MNSTEDRSRRRLTLFRLFSLGSFLFRLIRRRFFTFPARNYPHLKNLVSQWRRERKPEKFKFESPGKDMGPATT